MRVTAGLAIKVELVRGDLEQDVGGKTKMDTNTVKITLMAACKRSVAQSTASLSTVGKVLISSSSRKVGHVRCHLVSEYELLFVFKSHQSS